VLGGLAVIDDPWQNCARMDWSVLKVRFGVIGPQEHGWLTDDGLSSQWNQPSIDFYEKRLKAKMQSEWVGMRLEESTGGIEALKQLGKK
jgi:hypothetical protein